VAALKPGGPFKHALPLQARLVQPRHRADGAARGRSPVDT
jgi:hypothetical protein